MSADSAIRVLIALPIGLAVGSFMTVAVARVPAGESVVRPRSRCPSCGAQILERDNVPVVSWLLLRGRCRSCGAGIPPLYPLLEISTAVLVAGAFVVYDDLWQAFMIGALLAMMPAIAVIDIQHRIIPNRLMYPSLLGFPAYLFAGWLAGGELDPVRGMVGVLAFGGGLFIVAALSGGMGMGDVKLAALEGLVFGSLGLRYVGVAAGAAIICGGVGGIVALLTGRGRRAAIPFGPYLAVGAVIAAFWGDALADWYLRTFV